MGESVHMFMRDNITGGLVVRANLRNDGKIRYFMEAGHSYLIDQAGIDTMSRFGFRPRLHPSMEKEGQTDAD